MRPWCWFVRWTIASGWELSLKRNGDIEVVFGLEELDRVINALQAARVAARKSQES